MSCNRDGVVWLQANGKWAYGMFAYEYTNSESEDFDHEWDVEYDYGRFGWASSGHDTAEQAYAAWTGANPGGFLHVSERNDKTLHYDQMLEEYQQRQSTSQLGTSISFGFRPYF